MASIDNLNTKSKLVVVAFECREEGKQKDLVTHLNNLLNDLNGLELNIEVVAYGQVYTF